MQRNPWWPLVALLVVAHGGCGGRTLAGGNTNANGNNNTNLNTNTNPGDECVGAADCRVARKWDMCCSCPEAASAADLAADPCLIPLEQSAVPGECVVPCPAVECPPCPDAGRTVDCLAGECAFKEGRCTEDTECVAAIRVDMCCEQAFAATHADIAADPCLMVWPLYWQDIPQQCLDAQPEWCDLVDCAPSPPPSRALYCASDGCAFGSECSAPPDCTLLVDHRACCSCPEVWPASMAGHDPCVLPVGQAPPPGCYPEACLGVMCEQCPADPLIDCSSENTCVGVWPDWE